jgi:hypothetical protein
VTVTRYKVTRVERSAVQPFIETHHYSGSINGCITDFCFGLYDAGVLIGAAFFGRMAMAGQYKRFADTPSKVIELRRLCCVDNTPKNTESFFIGKMLRWLGKNTEIETVVSYADEEYGHGGGIYRASNFDYWGKTAGASVIVWQGKKYHDKAIRTKHKGVLKPFAVTLREALDKGEAQYKKTAGKHTYVYDLQRRR